MRSANKVGFSARAALAAAALSAALLLSGCGMPAAPHPPSLHLPEPVADLAAIRTGNQVALTWTMPRRDTDKLLLKGQIAARVCRRINGVASGDAASCDTVANPAFAPASTASFTDSLPPALAAGSPRTLTYFVDLDNNKSRSAGLSNPAVVVAGPAPAAVSGLSAELRKDGVVLRWTPGNADAITEAIRLNRKLVNLPSGGLPSAGPQTAQPRASQSGSGKGILAPPPIPADQNLLIEAGASAGRAPSGVAIDKQIQFGQTYEYRAQRVARVTVNGKTLEIDGPFSAPLRVDATETFLPDIPTGLAAVATTSQNGSETAIDLNWQPGTEADIAGYAVYRRVPDAVGGTAVAWQRISPAQPVIGPGYHDATVQSGHIYEYAVTAIDQGGHESAKSQSTQETVPGP